MLTALTIFPDFSAAKATYVAIIDSLGRTIDRVKTIAKSEKMVGQCNMLPFSSFCLTVLEVCQISLGFTVSFGLIACEFYTSFDGTVFVVVIWIGGPAASVKLSLEQGFLPFDVLYLVCQL